MQWPRVAREGCQLTIFAVQPLSVGLLIRQRVGHSDVETAPALISVPILSLLTTQGGECDSIQNVSLNINMNHAYNFEDLFV